MSLHIETPLIESDTLSEAAGRHIWLKLDALQPSGSFKIRGIGAACETYVQNGKRRFISSSGGNAGIAVAFAGRRLSIPVVVVVPETTTERARSLIRQQGAELIVHGAAWHEANTLAQSMLGEADAFLHPFDDPLLWQGHATLIDEVAASGIKPDAVVLSVGGEACSVVWLKACGATVGTASLLSRRKRPALTHWHAPLQQVNALRWMPLPASPRRWAHSKSASRHSTWRGSMLCTRR